MRILIMGFTKLRYMPYMNFYLENMDKDANEVHLLYWNRDLKGDIATDKRVVLHEFKNYLIDESSKVRKIRSFVRYRCYAKRLIRQGKFDIIIVLHSLTGVLIWETLTGRYKGKFIFDYRDMTFETCGPFRKVIGKIVNASFATFVSSDAFRAILPKSDKIYTSHNLLTDSLNHRLDFVKRTQGPLSVAFWGLIRHEAINRGIIKKLANDPRFELHYYGREQATAQNLKRYCRELGAANVFFHGEYEPDDRYGFAAQTQIIHNLYDNDTTKYAMGNKYYDGIIFRVPQLCMKGSFMGDRVEKAQIGFACEPYSDDFADAVYHYYINLDATAFSKRCDSELEKVIHEYQSGKSLLYGLHGMFAEPMD